MTIRHLGAEDVELLRSLNALFADVFEAPEDYAAAPPSSAWLADLLADRSFIALVALEKGEVVGGLAAYVLRKFEQQRSEIYIYDLAVAAPCRRRGIATALIAELQAIAADVGAWVIFVQADYFDPPAIALYEKIGRREDVLHFDIDPAPR